MDRLHPVAFERPNEIKLDSIDIQDKVKMGLWPTSDHRFVESFPKSGLTDSPLVPGQNRGSVFRPHTSVIINIIPNLFVISEAFKDFHAPFIVPDTKELNCNSFESQSLFLDLVLTRKVELEGYN